MQAIICALSPPDNIEAALLDRQTKLFHWGGHPATRALPTLLPLVHLTQPYTRRDLVTHKQSLDTRLILGEYIIRDRWLYVGLSGHPPIDTLRRALPPTTTVPHPSSPTPNHRPNMSIPEGLLPFDGFLIGMLPSATDRSTPPIESRRQQIEHHLGSPPALSMRACRLRCLVFDLPAIPWWQAVYWNTISETWIKCRPCTPSSGISSK